MSEHKITATSRKDEGKGASRRLRHAGQVPAIIYGGKSEPKSIQLEHERTWLLSQQEWFYASIIDLDVDGKTEKVLLRDMQRHPFKQRIMHLDFQRVSANEAIRVAVPLHFVNAEKSEAGKTAGVVITHELNDVQITCLPGDLPENIEVDLSTLKPGDTVHLSQVKLPKGVEVPELRLGADHDVAVVMARFARTETEETTEAAEGAAPAAAAAAEDSDAADAAADEGKGE
ncbi:50S ribosomal protein L25/general stress protein Ctc [Luteimonas sp. 50]|uniref:Large ribosomal subunit protein bL25 n=1 Tax=Cognatiluteimonas sedimenti TaxID=2927791 RepID=A0ABT0A306_9GAMM|nr:50S ribosomal protein L25/general stress protein Ctc [Lysobacter sedimenti]MCJ0825363.1 50S ribosomal protein L25/general stress protein Ctc [Lysobacter sedimenti]